MAGLWTFSISFLSNGELSYHKCIFRYLVLYISCLSDNTRESYLLLRVRECNTNGLDAALPAHPVVTYTRLSTPDIVHASTMVAAVGRVKVGNGWAIIDKSRDAARPRFVDEEGGDDYD